MINFFEAYFFESLTAVHKPVQSSSNQFKQLVNSAQESITARTIVISIGTE